MYTRCPSCRAEISFEPPANMADLPDGYKHRIKCPSCGVTIGVKIPRQDALAEVQPTYQPANSNATSSEAVYNTGIAEFDGTENEKPTKKTGIPRNLFMFFISLIFIVLNILSYLVAKNILVLPLPTNIEPYITSLFEAFSGLLVWEYLVTNFASFQSAIAVGGWIAFISIFALLEIALPALNLIISFACMCAKKYSRVFNTLFSLAFATLCVLMLFVPFIITPASYGNAIGNYFVSLIQQGSIGLIVLAALGFVQFLFSLFFLGSMKKKAPKVKKVKD